MKHGFISVSAAAPKVKVGGAAHNGERITELICEAAKKHIHVIAFPELSLSSATAGDLFARRTLISDVENELFNICKATENLDIIAVVGAPLSNMGKLFNCAVFIRRGDILGVVPKTHITSGELRHFAPAPIENGEIELFGGKKYPFGAKLLFKCTQMSEFCIAAEIGSDMDVPASPSVSHAVAGATIIANLSARPEAIGEEEYRRLIAKAKSAQLICAYICSDAGEGESSTDFVFSAHGIVAENGHVIAESLPFENMNSIISTEIDTHNLIADRAKMNTYPTQNAAGYNIISFDCNIRETAITRAVDPHPFSPSDKAELDKRCRKILEIQSRGLIKRLDSSYSKGAVINVSGGLDSCLALLVIVRAFDNSGRDRRDITAISLPCFGTSKRTKNNAEILCENLGVTFKTIDIAESVEHHFRTIGHDSANTNVVFENAQARERTQIGMDIANAQNSLFVGTGDLSEFALGWATYNGDHMSMYGVNASVPKTLVQHVVAYCADNSTNPNIASVLRDILATPISPELLPPKGGEISQVTEDIVGPYELHDFFIYHTLRHAAPANKIYRLALIAFEPSKYPPETIQKWLAIFTKRFITQQFKRSCSPDGPKTGLNLSPRGGAVLPSDGDAAAGR